MKSGVSSGASLFLNKLKHKIMAWSKITNKCKKPFKWYIHKVLCEYGYLVRNKDNYATYYHHLNMCCSYGFNLYGEPITNKKTT